MRVVSNAPTTVSHHWNKLLCPMYELFALVDTWQFACNFTRHDIAYRCTLKFTDSKITKWLDIRLGIYHWWKMWKNAIYSTSKCENKVSSMLWKGGNDLDLAWKWPTNSYPSIFTTAFRIWNPCWGTLWIESVPLGVVFNAR